MPQRVRPLAPILLAAGLVAVVPAPAAAQLGVGPRLSWTNPDVTVPGLGSDRSIGAAIRAALSMRLGAELSFDYGHATDPATGLRVRTIPVQASVLLYPLRSRLSIYLLGGYGWYYRRFEPAPGTSGVAFSDRRTGWHTGLGGELIFGRHLGAYLDYRYLFVHHNEDVGASGGVPIPWTGGVQGDLHLSHEGSAWTTGVTIYF
jgi:hypothetical protein